MDLFGGLMIVKVGMEFLELSKEKIQRCIGGRYFGKILVVKANSSFTLRLRCNSKNETVLS